MTVETLEKANSLVSSIDGFTDADHAISKMVEAEQEGVFIFPVRVSISDDEEDLSFPSSPFASLNFRCTSKESKEIYLAIQAKIKEIKQRYVDELIKL